MSLEDDNFPRDPDDASAAALERNLFDVQSDKIRAGARAHGFFTQQGAIPPLPVTISFEAEETTRFVKADPSLRGDFEEGFQSGISQNKQHNSNKR